MISDTLSKQIAHALKSKDRIRLSTLKLLYSALNYKKIAKQADLTEEEEMAVVGSEVKKRKDAIAIYKKVGASDKAQKEQEELAILKEYLPEELSDEKITKIVEESISELNAKSLSDIGRVMGAVMNKMKGRVDGSRVSEIVKRKLS